MKRVINRGWQDSETGRMGGRRPVWHQRSHCLTPSGLPGPARRQCHIIIMFRFKKEISEHIWKFALMKYRTNAQMWLCMSSELQNHSTLCRVIDTVDNFKQMGVFLVGIGNRGDECSSSEGEREWLPIAWGNGWALTFCPCILHLYFMRTHLFEKQFHHLIDITARARS